MERKFQDLGLEVNEGLGVRGSVVVLRVSGLPESETKRADVSNNLMAS